MQAKDNLLVLQENSRHEHAALERIEMRKIPVTSLSWMIHEIDNTLYTAADRDVGRKLKTWACFMSPSEVSNDSFFSKLHVHVTEKKKKPIIELRMYE